MSRIPSPRTPVDSDGSPDDAAAEAALSDVAEHLGPIDEVVRERLRDKLLAEFERDPQALREWVERDGEQ